jgi:hypothetical protein
MMAEFEIDEWPETDALARGWMRRFVEERGLAIRSLGTLKQYSGCLHWHLCKQGQRGTLEATWWPVKRRFWFKSAANRTAPWVEETLSELQGRGSPFEDEGRA